jgi:hypothetical protein
MKSSYCQRLKTLLDGEEVPCEIMKDAIDNKIDQLFIPFGDTPVGLAVTAVSPELLAAAGTDFGVQLVQFHVALPIEVDKSVINAVSEIMNRLNMISPIPGWSFERSTSILHFRYVACTHGDTLHKGQVTYIMQLIMFYMNTYIPLLEELCNKKAKFSEVVARMEEAMKEAAEKK